MAHIMNRYRDQVNRQVRAGLAASDTTQAALARELGLSRQSLSKRINGHRGWTVSELFTIEHVLNIRLHVEARGDDPVDV